MKAEMLRKIAVIFIGFAMAVFVSGAAPAFSADKEEVTNPSELDETYVGNVVADAMRAALNSEVALINGGSLGFTELPEKLDPKNITGLVPFSTDLVVAVRLKGDALRRVLEKSCQLLPRRSSTFLQVSGLTMTCDLNQPSGKRVTSVKVGGKALEPAKDYVVAATEFLSSGGGGMRDFKEGKVVSEKGVPIGEIVLKNAQYNKKRIGNVEGRIFIIPVEEEK